MNDMNISFRFPSSLFDSHQLTLPLKFKPHVLIRFDLLQLFRMFTGLCNLPFRIEFVICLESSITSSEGLQVG